MTAQIVRMEPDQVPPTPFSEPSLDALRRGYATMDGKPVKRFLPTPKEQARIRTLIATLKSRLVSYASQAEIGIELAKLVAAFPPPASASATQSDLRVDAYYEALDGLPLWAIRQAREKIVRGETSLDTRFAPTPPQFSVLVRSFTTAVERDLGELERILARVEEPELGGEEHSRVANGFDSLLAELGGAKRETDSRSAFEKRCAALGIDPAAIDALPDASRRAPLSG